MAEESGTLVGSADPWIMTAFAAYSAMLMLKFLLNIMLIIVTRTRLKIVPNPEDVMLMGKDKAKEVKVDTSHPLLCRVQR
ncbi:hypothetical protein EB796_004127 [Bugula neritina]|uniref:Uncharacterized protein n=1 Tax=Bugula neritina TaxID=10212 RepID=A0A7J7KH49_BUGNE|nr:hypothetical protein EB796_004127 [Bugula neritina]